MDRVFEANTSATPPTGPGTATGYPSDGDIDTATPATVPGAWWFWMITAELLALIVGAGLAPSGAALNQVFLAVQAIAAEAASAAASAAQTAAETFATAAASAAQTAAETFATAAASAAQAAAQNTVLGWFTGSNQLLAVNGFQKLPGGGIRQTCDISLTSIGNTDVTVTYPMSYPNLGKQPLASVLDPTVAGGNESNFMTATVISYSNSGCVIGLGVNGGGNRNATLHVEVDGD